MRCSSRARNSERRVKPNARDILSRTSTDALALQFSIRLRCSKDMSDSAASFSCVRKEACLLRWARMRSPTALRMSNSLARIDLSVSTFNFAFGVSTDSYRGFGAWGFGRAHEPPPKRDPARPCVSGTKSVNSYEVKGAYDRAGTAATPIKQAAGIGYITNTMLKAAACKSFGEEPPRTTRRQVPLA